MRVGAMSAREFICSAILTRDPTPEQQPWCLDCWDGRLFIFDSTGMMNPELPSQFR